jgi:DNA-binding NarL/FixJ family response regulator
MKTTKTKVLLADDHALMRMGLKALIDVQPDLKVVGEADDGEAAVRAAAELRPDVVVMDLAMPGVDGAEATKRILDANPDAKIVILTAFADSADVGRALACGARGAQMKGNPAEDLLEAIRVVRDGFEAVAPEIRRLLAETPKPIELTERQKEILSAVARGFTTPDIAEMLGISQSAVKQHLAHVCEKLGAANRSEAAAIAIRRQIVKV